MDDWLIEPLSKSHDRTEFSCGNQLLDDFLRTRVSQYEKRNLGKTFVAVPAGAKKARRKVAGFYTLAAGAVPFDNLPKDTSRKLPGHPVPVVLLARLAISLEFQGKGLGEGLLLDALERTVMLSGSLGVYAVLVDAIDESAVSFYKRYGFRLMETGQPQLFLPIDTARKLFGD